jgi:hypothetical protein
VAPSLARDDAASEFENALAAYSAFAHQRRDSRARIGLALPLLSEPTFH